MRLISFLQQLLTHGGFYNEELNWINIEMIQFVFSMPSAEKRPISPRFASIVRISSIHDTNLQRLVTIYSHYLTVILKDSRFKDAASVAAIATSIVRVFEKFKSDFLVDDYPHYDFTFRDITRRVIMLERYIHNSNEFTPNIVFYEGLRHFVDRLTSHNDRQRTIKDMKNIFRETMPSYEETDFEYTNYQIESNDKPPLYLVQTEKPIAQDAFRKLVVSYEREMGHLEIFRMFDTEYLAHRIIGLMAVLCSSIVTVTTPGLSFIEILKVIAHSNGVEIYSPPALVDFGHPSFAAFLKDLIPKVVAKDEEVVVLVEDWLFADYAILDALNSLMASGEIGGLFAQTEFDSLIASVQGEYRDSNTSGVLLQESPKVNTCCRSTESTTSRFQELLLICSFVHFECQIDMGYRAHEGTANFHSRADTYEYRDTRIFERGCYGQDYANVYFNLQHNQRAANQVS